MKIDKMNLAELKEYLSESRTEITDLATRSESLTGEDADRFDALETSIKKATERKAQIEARAASMIDGYAAGTIASEDDTRTEITAPSLRGALTLRKDQSLSDYNRDNGIQRGSDISLDQIVRGIANGNWNGVNAEARALVEGTQSAGGVLVPVPVSATVIDAARAQAQVVNAGATLVPMNSTSLRVPRLVNEGSAQFYAEAQQRVAQDMSFDAVTLTAKSFERLILVSNELLEDSNPNVGNVIQDAFAKQIAAGLDQAALYGDGSAATPLGITNTPGVVQVAHGANGTALSGAVGYDWLVSAAGAVRAANWEPTAHIVNPRTATKLALLKNSQNDYLSPPSNLLPILSTTNVPSNQTVGSSTTASSIITGDFRQLYIGVRQQMSLRVLTERYADTGQTAFLATMRVDIQLAHASAFQVDTGVL